MNNSHQQNANNPYYLLYLQKEIEFQKKKIALRQKYEELGRVLQEKRAGMQTVLGYESIISRNPHM